ncbi:hypothetical protein NONO_c51700 [Nocardia nova SH22a]|uniref:Uncharacterized protein n=2 Tax=Nocardia nova TaxID=37330 RepID=W5TLE8_9NOCA|nr:hypothetical protein NONO_c51700 [Nocardia nova SH22a]
MLEMATILLPLLAFQLSPALIPAAVEVLGYLSDRHSRKRDHTVHSTVDADGSE